jgi:peptidyl-prolyl cis-trans isomerase A (cyclophilin A)
MNKAKSLLVASLLIVGCTTVVERPVVVTLATAAGEIDVQLFTKEAPLSSADFLQYVDRGLYDGAAFYRVVNQANDRGTPKIEVIQGGLLDEKRALPPIAHETTARTGIRHVDGTLSLARGAVGTGSARHFFICIGDQPAIDFGGKRNPDGQGFAAFGRVIRGMDVVRKIQAMPADAPAESEYMKGQMLSPPVVIEKAFRVRARATSSAGTPPAPAPTRS